MISITMTAALKMNFTEVFIRAYNRRNETKYDQSIYAVITDGQVIGFDNIASVHDCGKIVVERVNGQGNIGEWNFMDNGNLPADCVSDMLSALNDWGTFETLTDKIDEENRQSAALDNING